MMSKKYIYILVESKNTIVQKKKGVNKKKRTKTLSVAHQAETKDGGWQRRKTIIHAEGQKNVARVLQERVT